MRVRTAAPGDKNIVGANVRRLRLSMGVKQKDLLARLQIRGVDMSAASLSKVEAQIRQVTDYELKALAQALQTTADALLAPPED